MGRTAVNNPGSAAQKGIRLQSACVREHPRLSDSQDLLNPKNLFHSSIKLILKEKQLCITHYISLALQGVLNFSY